VIKDDDEREFVSNLFTTESDRTIKKELDKEAFLRILTTQLKNQESA